MEEREDEEDMKWLVQEGYGRGWLRKKGKMKKIWNGWFRKEGKIKRIWMRLVVEEREDEEDMEWLVQLSVDEWSSWYTE